MGLVFRSNVFVLSIFTWTMIYNVHLNPYILTLEANLVQLLQYFCKSRSLRGTITIENDLDEFVRVSVQDGLSIFFINEAYIFVYMVINNNS